MFLKAVFLSERLYKIGLVLTYNRFYSYKIEQQLKMTCNLKVFFCSRKHPKTMSVSIWLAECKTYGEIYTASFHLSWIKKNLSYSNIRCSLQYVHMECTLYVHNDSTYNTVPTQCTSSFRPGTSLHTFLQWQPAQAVIPVMTLQLSGIKDRDGHRMGG